MAFAEDNLRFLVVLVVSFDSSVSVSFLSELIRDSEVFADILSLMGLVRESLLVVMERRLVLASEEEVSFAARGLASDVLLLDEGVAFSLICTLLSRRPRVVAFVGVVFDVADSRLEGSSFLLETEVLLSDSL